MFIISGGNGFGKVQVFPLWKKVSNTKSCCLHFRGSSDTVCVQIRFLQGIHIKNLMFNARLFKKVYLCLYDTVKITY